MRALVLVIAAAIAGATMVSGTAVARDRAQLPAGFHDTLVATVEDPLALAPIPDGRMLVADQQGKIFVLLANGKLAAKPALDLTAKVCAGFSERGVLGVAVDPAFASNRFVYVYYTFRNHTQCPTLSADSPVDRVARFEMHANTIDPASQKILIDGIVSYTGNHEAGALGFGRDGMLYVSVGDSRCDSTGASGCDGDNATARRGNTLHGKVLRITKTGGIPSDNPFRGAGTARCNRGDTGRHKICQETYLRGLRNPFRFAFDPNAKGTRLVVDDVGQDKWEEIDVAKPGADSGWNVREGDCVEGSVTRCGRPPAGMTNPIYAYRHQHGCGTITGGAFVPKGVWPARFRSDYLYADYLCGRISRLVPDGAGGWTSKPFVTGLGAGSVIALQFAPRGAKTALYYTTYANGGELHAITHS
jgi:glucose/arabinose dehydrogenase